MIERWVMKWSGAVPCQRSSPSGAKIDVARVELADPTSFPPAAQLLPECLGRQDTIG